MTRSKTKLFDQWMSIARRVGHLPAEYVPARNDTPAFLLDALGAGEFHRPDGRLDRRLLKVAVEDAWSSAEFPSTRIDVDVWEQIFDDAGFMNDGLPARRPTSVPTLYRGCPQGERLDTSMSWTSDLDTARWFAWRWDAPVWQVEDVHPVDVLAIFETARLESEYVLRPLLSEYLEPTLFEAEVHPADVERILSDRAGTRVQLEVAA